MEIQNSFSNNQNLIKTNQKNLDNMPKQIKDSPKENLASFTFGGKKSEQLKEILGNKNNISGLSIRRKCSDEISENDYSISLNVKNVSSVGMSNRFDNFNSFINSIIQMIWNMRPIYEVFSGVNSSNSKDPILISLHVSLFI